MVRTLLGTTLVWIVLSATAAAAEKAYRIGNSLTWDSQPKAIEALAAQREWKHVEAYHINCGKSLERIWTHPDEICVKAVEKFTAGVTTLATLYGRDPAGLKCPPNCYGSGKDFTPELYAVIHQAVWAVITEMHEVTGVGGPAVTP